MLKANRNFGGSVPGGGMVGGARTGGMQGGGYSAAPATSPISPSPSLLNESEPMMGNSMGAGVGLPKPAAPTAPMGLQRLGMMARQPSLK